MNFHQLNHKMWTSPNGTLRKAIREYGPETGMVAIYLMTSPHANQSGIFYCPEFLIAKEMELPEQTISECLNNLEKLGFCRCDTASELIWVVKMVAYQVPGWPKKQKDNRYQGVMCALKALPETFLVELFCEMWAVSLDDVGGVYAHKEQDNSTEQYSRDPSKGLARGLQGASTEPKILTVGGAK